MKRRRSRLSKRFCIYCGGSAGSRDHVPPKLLLEEPFPPNLKTVPSCRACNQGASLDEQYFLAILVHASSSETLGAKFATGGAFDRTLNVSPGLEERLLAAIKVDEATGLPFIEPETFRLQTVLKKIALGLFVLRYGSKLPLAAVGAAELLPYESGGDGLLSYFKPAFAGQLRRKRWNVVQEGVFSYVFFRGALPRREVWCLIDIHRSFFGLIQFPNPQEFNRGGAL